MILGHRITLGLHRTLQLLPLGRHHLLHLHLLLLLGQHLLPQPLLLVLLELLALLRQSFLLLRLVPNLHLALVPFLLHPGPLLEDGPLRCREGLPPRGDGLRQGGEANLAVGRAVAALLPAAGVGGFRGGRGSGGTTIGGGIVPAVDDAGTLVLEEPVPFQKERTKHIW